MGHAGLHHASCRRRAAARAVGARAAGPTSSYLEGSVAVGIVIVQGPTAELQFTDAELTKVVAEVQNGLGWLATANPLAGIGFSYDIQNVTLTIAGRPERARPRGALARPGDGRDRLQRRLERRRRLRRGPAQPASARGGRTARSSPSTRSATSRMRASAARGW